MTYRDIPFGDPCVVDLQAAGAALITQALEVDKVLGGNPRSHVANAVGMALTSVVNGAADLEIEAQDVLVGITAVLGALIFDHDIQTRLNLLTDLAARAMKIAHDRDVPGVHAAAEGEA